ncbi:hypothetical protein QA942_25420 [Streptomyces sp. B21-106]|uniref:hypothetical protein n=1 Tax=Streptomyces sp. B21-106 TaxID=3039418 RepID=UPI002FF41ADF
MKEVEVVDVEVMQAEVVQVEVVELLVSASHRLAGRPADGPSMGPDDERVPQVEVRRGLGLVGDRYFGRPAHRDASVTVMSAENLPGTSPRPSVCCRPAGTSSCAAWTSTRASARRSCWTGRPDPSPSP